MPSRRSVLKGGIAILAAPSVISSAVHAQNSQITISDVGGAVQPALKQAFYDPFEKQTGIRVVAVAQEPNPVTQIKLLVDTKSYIWDVSMTTRDHVKQLTEGKPYVAEQKLGLNPDDYIAGSLQENWMGFSVYGIALALNTKSLPGAAPKTWADYWNVKDFPGRRGLYRSPVYTLELALLADGVPPSQLYPIDADRAFAALTRIRKNISVWWSSGAQNTQILQSGEVDMCDTWSARSYAAIAGGAPLKMVWNGLYSIDGWSIANGTPRMEAAREFVKFAARPEQQAIYSSLVANGPSAKKAYNTISAERALVLPTAPANIAGLTLVDSDYWGAKYKELSERFNEWLLAG
jgi:putative spermidine/putrescine transport system substrate-binding protein